ncbi:hypothetical protein VTH06DRAFT_103 [Thermothelomyces fergusii]
MKTAAFLSTLAAATAVHGKPTATGKSKRAELEPITIKGNAFFQGDKRFYIRGIAYQPGGAAANIDPLADPDICLKDIPKFKKLGVNVLRVYSTDNSKDHDECMDALAEAGIYVALDANNPLYSINRDDPHGSYNTPYLQSVFATIDAFAKYPNTMAFFSGNEVIHDLLNTTRTAPYVKATDRDMRRYIKARGYRKIPVGYSAADVTTNRMQTAHFFNCGSDEERSDFFAFNDYSWCTSDFVTSGWNKKVEDFKGYGIPLFLSEYGCNVNPRNFGEIESLMHRNMTGVYSGGLLYEYSMERNKYGIVKIKGADQKGEREELPEFAAFAAALKKWPAPTDDGGYTKTSSASECPTKDSNWDVESSVLPEIPKGALKFFEDGAGKGPGLDGPGSQWAVDQASSSPNLSSGTSEDGESTSSSAAVRGSVPALDKAPFVVSGVVLLFTLVGAAAF